jgi:hypothetical protein
LLKDFLKIIFADDMPLTVFPRGGYGRIMKSDFWNYGEKAKVARAAGIPAPALSDILSGVRGCGLGRARRLEAATALVLGKSRMIPAAAWIGLEEHSEIKKRGVE